MSKLRFPPLDEDVRALVRRAATIETAPEGARARVLARVETITGTAGAPGEGNASNEPPSPFVGRAVALTAAFALGGAFGAFAMYRVMRAPVPVEAPGVPSIERDLPKVPAEVTPAQAITATPQPVEPPKLASPLHLDPVREGTVPAAAIASPRPSSTDTPDPAADERVLLDRARGAVEREDGAEALTVTQEHARKYPRGALVQEREAIAVRALVLLGRRDEARARVDRFRERFPDSLLLPALESSAGTEATP
jgi:hypothetical protein